MKLFAKKVHEARQREVKANDEQYNSNFDYVNNEIKTSYYTWYNFIFKNLFEQFHRVVNIYFIFLFILQCIPEISSLNPITTLIPVIIVLGITAVKDAYDDFYRHKSDKEINTRKVSKVKSGKYDEDTWMNLKVGDIVRLRNNDHVPADLLLLSSSEDENLVYIETAELDGETNFKIRQALPETGALGEDLSTISEFSGKVECEAPNNVLHKFTGNLYWKDKTHSIDNDMILLRGCTLRNTQWCFGLVIFAGSDTKLMQNTGKRTMKRTSIERFMNKLVWGIFLFLFILIAIAAIVNSIWEADQGDKFQVYLPWDPSAPNPSMAGFLMFWSNLIILSTLVPISLYVSIEFIRLGQSLFINWDRQMFYGKKNLPAVARTTTLNEELGQVQHIFSDKTGTLTQNIMKFCKCSIAGKRYGDVFDRNGKMVLDVDENYELEPVDLSHNQYAEKDFRFYDQKLIDKIENGNESCAMFFRLLTLCHSGMIEEKEGEMVYHTQSPDENALLSAARNFGFVFKEKSFDTITVLEKGKPMVYKILATLDFNNVRKRMSVIVKDEEGKILLLCKGADSVVYERLHTGCDQRMKNITAQHLNSFSRTGLRTLCLAMKEINENDFDVWYAAYHKASTALEDREGRLDAVYEEIERDLTLLGATAIEDKLQDGVPETIAKLVKANIKIWVLTGDKQETAINIGYSCNMLTDDMKDVFIIKEHDPAKVEKEIDQALAAIQGSQVFENASFEADNGENLISSNEDTNNDDKVKQDKNTYGLVINGHSLAYALDADIKMKFLDLASECSAVICCRATPLQKANVVELVKKNKKVVTLAIGDGANDVSMIKAAHIGVGISGEEGTQAVLSSDFAFGQFRFLERLLLVHGRWSYMRICKFLNYFFFKNFAFTLVHFWYGIFVGFTAQSAYDDWYITIYNIVYTSTPILAIGIFEQDCNEEKCLQLPKLYLPGQTNALFNVKFFFVSIFQGFYCSVVLLFFTYGTLLDSVNYNGMPVDDHQTMAYIIATALVFLVNLKVALDTQYWTAFNHVLTWGSIAIYFPFTLGLCSDGFFNLFPSQAPFIGAPRYTFSISIPWLTIVLILAICLLPVVTYQYLCLTIWPSHTLKVLRQFKKTQTKLRNGHIEKNAAIPIGRSEL